MHTVHSDGTLSPAEVIGKAAEAGLAVISITDHDTVSGLEEAIASGRNAGLEVVPGVELSALTDDGEIHVLGYFIDHTNKELVDTLAEFREERLRRAERIIDKLNKMNIPLRMESVLANTTGDSVGRPHIANALVNEGHAESYKEAFKKYIGDGRPAYERKMTFSPEVAIRMINRVGGLSFLAHPGRAIGETLLLQVIDAGLDGIEVVHPGHTPDLVRYYRGIVNQYCLLESGGSDFHGGQRNDIQALGQYWVPVEAVTIMRNRLASQ